MPVWTSRHTGWCVLAWGLALGRPTGHQHNASSQAHRHVSRVRDPIDPLPQGGAVAAADGGTVGIEASLLAHNRAGMCGGAVFVGVAAVGYFTMADIKNSRLVSNSALQGEEG